jgi:hypothetical protein
MAKSEQKIERNMQGLVDALFNSIDRLNNKEIDAEQARAISHTAKTIVSVAALELEYRKWAGSDGRLVHPLESLVITGPSTPPQPGPSTLPQ